MKFDGQYRLSYPTAHLPNRLCSLAEQHLETVHHCDYFGDPVAEGDCGRTPGHIFVLKTIHRHTPAASRM